MGNMGTFLPCRLASSPLTLGLPQAQPAAEEPASPWGRPELFFPRGPCLCFLPQG
jgi:hypothetical protein